jgi:hypothetical protein
MIIHSQTYRFFISIISFLFCFSLTIQAQSGFSASAGARSVGIGQITTTLNGMAAGFGNCATIPFYRSTGAQVFALQRFNLAELKEIGITTAFSAGKNGSFFGSIQHFGFETYQEQKLGIGYGLKLTPTTAASIQLDVYQFRITEYGNTIQPGFEIGLFSQPFKQISLGAHISNPIQLKGENGIRIPTLLRFGGAYFPSTKVSVYGELEKDIDFPVAVKAGLEYFPVEQFTIRLGAISEPASVHLGVGYLIQSKIRVDLGLGYSTLLGITPSLGLTFLPVKSGS